MNNNRMFRKRPVVVEAIQWTGVNLYEVIEFTDGPPQIRSHHAGMMWENYSDLVKKDGLKIYTLEGVMSADIGDWIIKGVKGENYPCKPDVFDMTYESAIAPAADLADLIPDAKAIRKEAGGYAPVYSLQEQQLFIDGATWLSAAILRNIEEKLK